MALDTPAAPSTLDKYELLKEQTEGGFGSTWIARADEGGDPPPLYSVLRVSQSLVKKADLVAALTAADVTVFAPTNDAFAKVPAATLDALMVNPDALKQVLLFHVVSGRVVDDGLKVSQLRSLEGSSIDLKMDGTNMMAGVLKADVLTGGTYSTRIDAGNSVIYPIDSVLLPPTLK